MLKLNTKVIENFVAEEECNIATTTRVTAAVAADIIATQRLLSYIILLVCFINFSSTTTAIFLYPTRYKCCRNKGQNPELFTLF